MANLYRDVTRILGEHGWTFLRAGKGSHEVWANGSARVSVPRKLRKRATANAILKHAKTGQKI